MYSCTPQCCLSTNAITSLVQFIAKAENNVTSVDIPVSELRSDVEGIKPVVFDVGKDEVQFKKALERCHELMGNNVTLLHESKGANLPGSMVDICESYGKSFGGLWECYHVNEFFGWEANKVVDLLVSLDFFSAGAKKINSKCVTCILCTCIYLIFDHMFPLVICIS